jgi:hypothetical protein
MHITLDLAIIKIQYGYGTIGYIDNQLTYLTHNDVTNWLLAKFHNRIYTACALLIELLELNQQNLTKQPLYQSYRAGEWEWEGNGSSLLLLS